MGISGLVLAGLLAAAMSSLSSGINSSCLVIIKDFICRFRKKATSESAEIKLAKIISFGIGVAIVLVSLIVGKVKGNLLEMCNKVFGMFVAPLFVPFFMAMFFRRGTTFGTFVGTLASLTVGLLISFSDEFFGTPISFLWIIPGSLLVGIAVSIILSLLWPNKNKQPESE